MIIFLRPAISHVFLSPGFSGPDFSGFRFFRIQVFQSPGFSRSRFFKVQVQSQSLDFRGNLIHLQHKILICLILFIQVSKEHIVLH